MSISEQEAQDLVSKFIDLKEKYNKTKSSKDKRELINHENILVEKLKYLVHTKTNQYKKFSNYDDLNQDGYEALVMGLKNFDKSKGSIFWWLHKYIDTRIYRSANSYSTVRIPMAVAKHSPPKIDSIPIHAKDNNSTEFNVLKNVDSLIIQEKLNKLSKEDKEFITDMFGIEKEKISVDDYNKKTGIKKSKINYKIKAILKKMRDI
jgi:DNA-directed RNA polymerase specialized sigma subunit